MLQQSRRQLHVRPQEGLVSSYAGKPKQAMLELGDIMSKGT